MEERTLVKSLAVIFGKGASPGLEISFVIACVLTSEWISPLLFGKSWIAGAIPAFLALVFIIRSQIGNGESVREQGWRLDNLPRASVLLVLPMAVTSLGLAAIGWLSGGLSSFDHPVGLPILSTSLGLFVWGLIQQYPLQSFINRRAQAIWGKNFASVLFVAIVFAFLHVPNLWLMAATFAGGLMWSYVYQRAPNLWALAASHAVMTAVLVMTVPYSALHGLRVGYNYFW